MDEAVADDLNRTLDFLLRQAMHAVLTHRRLAEAAEAEAGESLSLFSECDLALPFALERESMTDG